MQQVKATGVMRVPVAKAAGYVLAKDLPPMPGTTVPMLKAGANISQSLVVRLASMGIREIDVAKKVEIINPEDIMPAKARTQAAKKVNKAFDKARAAFEQDQKIDKEAIKDLIAVSKIISDNLVSMPHAALAITNLASADEYTHEHSVNVAALGILIARAHFRKHGWTDHHGRKRKDQIEARLTKLGMGLLLHDIGKMNVSLSVLNKPGKLDEAEWKQMRQHPLDGYDLLQETDISTLSLSIIRDHHERIDGSGYPNGLLGDDIHEFSRIAAIADVYDAITSERPYKSAQPPAKGVKIIRDGRGTAFDKDMVDTFLEIVFPFPVGSAITTPEGENVIVTKVDPAEPYRPYAKVKKRFKSSQEVQIDLTSQA